MTRVSGRNIYIVDLKAVLAGCGGAKAFATRSKECKFTAVWIRLARGAALDVNFTLPGLPDLQRQLAQAGVALWGWHVPFCADDDAARTEADNVVNWADQFSLAGVVIDAERTPESPRFRGTPDDATTYLGIVQPGLSAKGRGIALSSHDQPLGHPDFPFAVFLPYVADNCPQVYYHSTADVTVRLNKSVRQYGPLENGRNFQDRFKPTGNITTRGDQKLADAATCIAAADVFMTRVHRGGYRGYSFWCWDSAPDEIWQHFKTAPV